MKRSTLTALAGVGLLLAASAARAGNVQWSIGITLPPVTTVVSSGPGYYPEAYPEAYADPMYSQPVVYAPPRVRVAPRYVYLPQPVVYAPQRVVYRSVPRVVFAGGAPVYRPVPVVYGGWAPHGRARGWEHGGREFEHRRGGRGER
jgi:hypothetical protein